MSATAHASAPDIAKRLDQATKLRTVQMPYLFNNATSIVCPTRARGTDTGESDRDLNRIATAIDDTDSKRQVPNQALPAARCDIFGRWPTARGASRLAVVAGAIVGVLRVVLQE